MCTQVWILLSEDIPTKLRSLNYYNYSKLSHTHIRMRSINRILVSAYFNKAERLVAFFVTEYIHHTKRENWMKKLFSDWMHILWKRENCSRALIPVWMHIWWKSSIKLLRCYVTELIHLPDQREYFAILLYNAILF